MQTFIVYGRRAYGPIGNVGYWDVRFPRLGSVEADDAIDAVRVAKLQGYVAPMVVPL